MRYKILFVVFVSTQAGVHDAAEFVLRHKLFDELLRKEEFMDAANCLGKLNLEATGGGKVSGVVCMRMRVLSLVLLCMAVGK